MQQFNTRRKQREAKEFLREAGLGEELYQEALYDSRYTRNVPSPKTTELVRLANNSEPKVPCDLPAPKNPLDQDTQYREQTQENLKKEDFSLDKLVDRPNYVLLEGSRIIRGYIGHSSVIFKRAILEGSYYVEVKLLSDWSRDHNASYPSSVKVGLCPYGYSCSLPLGTETSVALRTSDGAIVHNRRKQPTGTSWRTGDVLGLAMMLAPPQKHPQPGKLHDGSKLQFFKNRKVVAEFTELQQQFYCFGISLYNYAAVSVALQKSDLQWLPVGYRPFSESLKATVPYQNLKNSRMFNV